MKRQIITILISSSIFLFLCSSLRHLCFHSTAGDLGIFDQAVYLISQGQTPVSSLLNFHILADHAAFIWYPISLLYRIYPSVYWLFALQAIALTSGAYFVYQLSLQEKLSEQQALLIALAYLLYPTVISANFFDFHPDTIALPCYFWLVLVARQANQTNQRSSLVKFLLGILIILSCKAVLSLTVATIGLWLMFFERKRVYGAIAIASGFSWFIISTQIVIPYFGANAAPISRHIANYAYLGSSFPEVLTNILLKPQILIAHIFSLPILFYFLTLLLPVVWGLSFRHLSPIVCGFPQLLMSVLSSNKSFYTVGYHYTIHLFPFLFLAIITNVKAQAYLLRNRKLIIALVTIGFLLAFRPHIAVDRDLSSLTYSLQASRRAVAEIDALDHLRKDGSKGSVLTTAKIIPHLSQRSMIKLADANIPNDTIGTFDYILLNVRYPILTSTKEFAQNLSEQVKLDNRYKIMFQENDIVLFARKIERLPLK